MRPCSVTDARLSSKQQDPVQSWAGALMAHIVKIETATDRALRTGKITFAQWLERKQREIHKKVDRYVRRLERGQKARL